MFDGLITAGVTPVRLFHSLKALAMDELKRQVERARRRLNFDSFLRIVSWSLLAAMCVALVGVTIPKIWPLAVAPTTWNAAWLGGATAVGLLVGGWIAWTRRHSVEEAAIEIDRRFGLKERVASSLLLSPNDVATEAGQALVTDAARRVERVDVPSKFVIESRMRPLYPVAVAATAAVIAFLAPNAESKAKSTASNNQGSSNEREQLKKRIEELKQRIAEKFKTPEKKAEDGKGLQETTDVEKARQEIDKLLSQDIQSRKDALVKLNDVQKDLAKKRDQLSASNELKKKLEELKELSKGPGERMAESMQKGKFDEAAKELAKMQEKLEKGEMSADDQTKLGKQLEQLKEKIEKIKQEREMKKQELREAAEKMRQAGKLGEAAKLEKELERMEAQDGEVAKMADALAEEMKDAADALQKGDAQAAAKAMAKMAKRMEGMKDEMEAMEAMDEMLDELSEAKDEMGCEECKGGKGEGKDGKKGAKSSKSGKGNGQGKGQGQGNGLGEGKGYGERPEEETDTKKYDTQVKGKAEKGVSTRVGDAEGHNRRGVVTTEAQAVVDNAIKAAPDSIDETPLPRDQRENAKEYFERLRKGE